MISFLNTRSFFTCFVDKLFKIIPRSTRQYNSNKISQIDMRVCIRLTFIITSVL